MALCNRLFGYWGKAQAQPGSAVLWHPLVFHSVDVAAVASRALDARPDWLAWFAKQFNLEANACKQVLVWLLGLHDLGKFADNFQSKVPELYSAQFPDRELVPGGERHDSLGYAFWKQYARKLPAFAPLDQGFDDIIACVCGHHGLPPKAVGGDDLNLAFKSAARADALHYATLWTEFCFPAGAPALESVVSKSDGWLAGARPDIVG